MSDALKNKEIRTALRNVYETTKFCCLKVGVHCNGVQSNTFSSADCDLEVIPNLNQTITCLRFRKFYKKGFDLVKGLMSGSLEFEKLEDHYKKAFEILNHYFIDIGNNEASLLNEIKNKPKETLSETDVTVAFAVHLLGKLAPGQSFVIDAKWKGKEECKCKCQPNIKYGGTGIGYESVWHGFLDIVFSSHEGISSAAVTKLVVDPSQEPPVKKQKENDETSSDENTESSQESSDSTLPLDGTIDTEDSADSFPGGKCGAEVKTSFSSNGVENQSAAEAIVFSFVQKIRHPDFENFLIPTIVISAEKIRIIMYDSENDILLRSYEMPIFMNKELFRDSVILIWMVMHYRIFCSGISEEDLSQSLDNIKSGFMEHVAPCIDIYKTLLKADVTTFSRVQKKLGIDNDKILFGLAIDKSEAVDDFPM